MIEGAPSSRSISVGQGAPVRPPRHRAAALIAAAVLLVAGCLPSSDPPLVIATSWPGPIRSDLESAYHRESGDPRPISWVELGPGEPMAVVLGRRGGVDLFLGGSMANYDRLARAGRLARFDPSDPAPWRVVHRPVTDPAIGGPPALDDPPADFADPRDDPSALALARAALEAEGWPRGYEGLVRRAARSRPRFGRSPGIDRGILPAPALDEGAAVAQEARSPGRARRFLAILGPGRTSGPPGADPRVEATADGLLADLLGAALVDAHEDLRAADAALRRFAHPARAEAALGERPPWPPASVARLQASPTGEPLVDTLAEQVAPDPESRAWLRRSWVKPVRAVDGALLRELAGAADGRLAREPRFRAWLRGEWTAWSRQLYRRVSRVAGGYVPS